MGATTDQARLFSCDRHQRNGARCASPASVEAALVDSHRSGTTILLVAHDDLKAREAALAAWSAVSDPAGTTLNALRRPCDLPRPSLGGAHDGVVVGHDGAWKATGRAPLGPWLSERQQR